MKAQTSLEYILIVGFSLLVVGVLWTTSVSDMDNTQWELNLASAKNSVNRIANTADIAYVHGSPTQIYLSVDFPSNIENVYIQGNSVTLELRWKGFLRNISAYSDTNLTGQISPVSGRHKLLVAAGDVINISEA